MASKCDWREHSYFDILWAMIKAEESPTNEQLPSWRAWKDYALIARGNIGQSGESKQNVDELNVALAMADEGNFEDAAYKLENLLVKSIVDCRCHGKASKEEFQPKPELMTR